MIKLYISLLLFLYAGMVQARSYEKIILKNGSELEGYISLQRPGKEVIFLAENATIYIPSNRVQSTVDHTLRLDSLSAEWQEWAKNNPEAVKTENGTEYLVLTHLVLSDKEIIENDTSTENRDSTVLVSSKTFPDISDWNAIPHKVRILEKGIVVKYLDFSTRSYTLSWDEIQMIKRYKRAEMDLTGLTDVIELESGIKHEGQIIEQTPGKQVRLLKDDGIVEVISSDQIAVHRRVKLNPNQDLFEQVPLLDIVRTRSGEEIKGIITEQDYGKKKVSSYMLIQTGQSNIQKVNNNTVSELRKVENPLYTLITDIAIKGNEILVNRKKTEPAVINERESVMMIDPASKMTTLDADSINHKVIIEMKENTENRKIILLKLTPFTIKKEGTRNAFTYEDLLTKGIQQTETSVSTNGTLKMVYPVSVKGDYILYTPTEKKTFWLKIK